MADEPLDPFADDPANRIAVLYRQLIELATVEETGAAIRSLSDTEVRGLLLNAMLREQLRHEDPEKYHRWISPPDS